MAAGTAFLTHDLKSPVPFRGLGELSFLTGCACGNGLPPATVNRVQQKDYLAAPTLDELFARILERYAADYERRGRGWWARR